MDDPALVRVLEPCCDLARDVRRLGKGDTPTSVPTFDASVAVSC